MNVFLCCTCLFIVLANTVVMTKSSDHASGSEYPVNYFSGEFESFLHGLGSMVYKYKTPARQTPDKTEGLALSVGQYGQEYSEPTPASSRSYRRKESHHKLKTQKDVLKDVLMMKLVSYYEDKYKITHSERQIFSTTPKNVPTFTAFEEHTTNDEVDKHPKIELLRTTLQPRRRLRNTVMQNDQAEVIVM